VGKSGLRNDWPEGDTLPEGGGAPIPPPPAGPPKPPMPRGRRLGRNVGRALYVVAIVWVVASGAFQIIREAVFAPRVPRSAEVCRAELASLRGRLAEAPLRAAGVESEVSALAAFRAALGGEAGRAWDQRALELVDGCPPPESHAAYALSRLRAAEEALLRLDVREAGRARRAHDDAMRALPPAATFPKP
jgi:hypothetical protein